MVAINDKDLPVCWLNIVISVLHFEATHGTSFGFGDESPGPMSNLYTEFMRPQFPATGFPAPVCA